MRHQILNCHLQLLQKWKTVVCVVCWKVNIAVKMSKKERVYDRKRWNGENNASKRKYLCVKKTKREKKCVVCDSTYLCIFVENHRGEISLSVQADCQKLKRERENAENV